MKIGDVLEVVTMMAKDGKITAPVGSLCTVTSIHALPKYVHVSWHQGYGHYQRRD